MRNLWWVNQIESGLMAGQVGKAPCLFETREAILDIRETFEDSRLDVFHGNSIPRSETRYPGYQNNRILG